MANADREKLKAEQISTRKEVTTNTKIGPVILKRVGMQRYNDWCLRWSRQEI